MLGVPAGALGYVFNEYDDMDDPEKSGVQIIFENGNYDGFSVEEREMFLEYVGYKEEYQTYDFCHVMKVARDFRNGYWKW
jgi:hypothetical protein